MSLIIYSPIGPLSVGLIVSAVLTVLAPFLANTSFEVFVASRAIIGMAEVSVSHPLPSSIPVKLEL